MKHLQKYAAYVRNASGVAGAIATSAFDEDWEPIGPKVRGQLLEAGLTLEEDEYMILTSQGMLMTHPAEQ